MSKKILLLGGSHGQIPAIKEAKRRGLYTILCDYLSDNPGQHLVDEFHLVSTTDKEKILEVAQQKEVDYILAYGSDPAVLTESYVKNKVGMPGNSTESIELLTHKDLFRKFQREHQFNTPGFIIVTDDQNWPLKKIEALFPAVVKPVDSSDTKGVSLVKKESDLQKAIEQAFHFTRCGRVIVEERVDSDIADLHGDGFVIDGELRFCELGDHLYRSIADPLKPSSTLFPSRINKKQVQQVQTVVGQLIKESGYSNGPVNIEVRINSENKIYIMEIGPRSGGSYIPQVIYQSTGFNMLEAVFDILMNKEVRIPDKTHIPAICFTLHSNIRGVFDSFEIDPDLKSFLVEKHLFVNSGDPVKPYNQPGSSLGALIFKFDQSEQVDEHIDNFYQKVLSGIHMKNTE